jgi:hypothetical protein
MTFLVLHDDKALTDPGAAIHILTALGEPWRLTAVGWGVPKPWRDCESNDERLDGENGLLLTPTVDHLFDRGFISFENNGDLLISPVVHRESLKRMGIPPDEKRNVGAFSEGQRRYLEYHRDLVFLEARVRRG